MFRILVFLLLPLTILAGENVARLDVLHLTLESAVQAAIGKSFAIQVQRFDPRIAQENVTRELGRFDPVFDLTYARGQTRDRSVFDNGIRLDRRRTSQLDDFSAGISGLSTLGTTYDLGLGSRSDAVLLGDSANNDLTTSTGSISLRQPLLRGFGPASTLAQVRIARNNVLVSEWALRQRIIDIITQTNFVFNDLHFAQENLLVAVRSRELARQLFKDNQARVQIGVQSPLDVTQARAEVAAREEGVILAQRTVLDNANILKQLVTNDMEHMLDVRVEIEPPPSTPFRADVPAGIVEALDLRPDYRQQILDIERRNITVAFTRNAALPRFDLTGSLALLGFDNDVGSSFGRLGRQDERRWTVGAIVSIPILNREARGAANAATLEKARSLIALKQLEQQIVVEVDNASGQIVTSRQRIASTTEASRLAKETVDAAQQRLQAGTGTTFEVLQLQKTLAEAEAAELRARADYNKAVGEYQRRTGTSLRVHNVVLN